MDAAVHHPELLKGLELNGQMSLQQTPPPACPPSPFLHDWEYIDGALGKSWWLVDTRVAAPLWNPFAPTSTPDKPYTSGAWDYSIGTGVTVAVLDKGFNTNHREIERRTRISAALGNHIRTNDPNDIPIAGGFILPDHGHDAIMTGFAERDNGLGTSGVAPNTNVIAYSNQGWFNWDIEKNIREATKHADILSLSTGSPDWTAWTLGVFGGLTGQGIMDRITEAVNANKVVVVGAGNASSGETIRYTGIVPAKHPMAIAVGAVDVSTEIGTSNSRFTESAIYGHSPYSNNPYWCARIPGPAVAGNTNPEKLSVAAFSNFGPEHSLVWAPGNRIQVQKKANNIYPDFQRYLGTSAATPFVAGVVALMKSRNPNLSPAQIKTILTQQARTVSVSASTNTNMKLFGFPDTFLIDAEKAVKLASATQAKPTETYFGYVASGGINTLDINLYLNKWVTPTASIAGVRRKYIREQTVSHEALARFFGGAYVKVSGWSNQVAV